MFKIYRIGVKTQLLIEAFLADPFFVGRDYTHCMDPGGLVHGDTTGTLIIDLFGIAMPNTVQNFM